MLPLHRFEQLSFDIAAIYQGIQKIERNEMVKFGLKGYYAQYLAAMRQAPEGVTAAQLCEMCDKDKAAVSRALSEMEERGLIERDRTGGSAYRVRLRLTDAGQAAAKFVCERVNLAVELAGQGLSESDRVIFYQTLHRIAENVQRLDRQGLPEQNPQNVQKEGE